VPGSVYPYGLFGWIKNTERTNMARILAETCLLAENVLSIMTRKKKTKKVFYSQSRAIL
jgi:hypothetical protein